MPTDRTLTANSPVVSIAFAKDGKTLLATYRDNRLRTWNLATGTIASDSAQAGFLLDSTFLTERAADRQSVQVWDLAAARKRFLIEKKINHAALSADGKQLAVSSEEEHNLRLLDPATGALRKTLPDGLGGAAAIAFSPDSATVVSSTYDNEVRIWKTESGELVRKLDTFTGAMFAAAFTPDGHLLVMAGVDETVYIFDAKTFQLQRKLTGHGEIILSLAVSPDSKTLVTGGFDSFTVANPVKLVFWDLPTGKMHRTVNAPHAVAMLAFAPDGKSVAMATAGGNGIQIFWI